MYGKEAVELLLLAGRGVVLGLVGLFLILSGTSIPIFVQWLLR